MKYNLVNKYDYCQLPDEVKRERMNQLYIEMAKSIQVPMLAARYKVSKHYIIELLAKWTREKFLTDDCHHSIVDYWFFFDTYLKKIC